MMKKFIAIIAAIFIISSISFASEKKDSTDLSTPAVAQQTPPKNLAKQKNVKQLPQSNWSKIKDLFM